MLVDEFHNIGGCAIYLLNCIDDLIVDTLDTKSASDAVNMINKRAAEIPAYKDHRRFTTGIFVRFLKNPAYTEIRSSMAIILPCCYDLIPLQASLCLRHFLDFVMHAAAKEHTEESLVEMEESLQEYYKYIPIFAKYSPTRFNFPKNHMLQKYANDIRSRGITSGYTTCNSERQHIIDVKKPAQRTNRRFDSIVQMANYVYMKDLLFDTSVNQSPKLAASLRAKKTITKINEKRYKMNYTFGSPAAAERISLLKKQPAFECLDKVLRSFLDTNIEKRATRVAEHNLPTLDSDEIKVYQMLTIKDNDTSGTLIDDKIRTHDEFHKRERKDFVVIEYQSPTNPHNKTVYEAYGQALLLFQAEYKSQTYDLVLIRRYLSCNIEHNTGLEVLSVGLDENYKGLLVAFVKQVKRSIHVVPDDGDEGDEREQDYEEEDEATY